LRLRRVVHKVAGEALHLPPNPAAAVGDPRDPARRPNVFRFSGLCLRLVRMGADYMVQPFLTVAQARAAMVSGAYYHRRRVLPALRPPDLLIGAQAALGETPLEGLSFSEAETLARLAGGRLPTEREIDYVLASADAIPMPSGVWHSWTASRWSPYSYSLALWDDTLRVWRAPESEPLGIADTNLASCMRFDTVLQRYPCSRLDAAGSRSWVVFDP
jgi:hypothetical protein